jgi:tetratricopeptide (TPR) repeat protein
MAEPTAASARTAGLPVGQPSVAEWSATALGHHQAGRLAEAEALYRQVLTLDQDHLDGLHNLGVLYRQLGRNEAAASLLARAVAVNDQIPSLYSHLAGALRATGRLEEAAAAYGRAVALEPNRAETHYNLANTLRDLGRTPEAAAAYARAITLKPDLTDAHNNLGNILKDRGELDAAAACYRAVLALKPDYAEVHCNLGNVLREQGDLDAAAASYRRALDLRADHAPAHRGLGAVLARKGELAAATASFHRAIALEPSDAEAHYNLGAAQKDQGELAAAVASFRRTIALKPDHVGAFYHLAGLRPMSRGSPEAEALFALLSQQAADLDRFEPARRGQLLFAMGKALEDRGDFDRAFACMAKANAIRRARLTFDITEAERLMEQIAAVFDRAMLERVRNAGVTDTRPIFVVGMPRSGSTLVEQIISAHPKAHGAGEIWNLPSAVAVAGGPDGAGFPEWAAAMTRTDCHAVGQAYLDSLPGPAEQRRRVTDKLLSNFQRLGLIHLCLPDAKIIHCRRDPRDVCLSCYGIHFSDGLEYAYDLTELARYWRAYDRLMDHWRSILPPGRMLEVPYEGVVEDVEAWARRLIAHCGLEWDDACPRFFESKRAVRTASSAQVRQPIYAGSVGRWRSFASHLRPLLDALGEPWADPGYSDPDRTNGTSPTNGPAGRNRHE